MFRLSECSGDSDWYNILHLSSACSRRHFKLRVGYYLLQPIHNITFFLSLREICVGAGEIREVFRAFVLGTHNQRELGGGKTWFIKSSKLKVERDRVLSHIGTDSSLDCLSNAECPDCTYRSSRPDA